jgi:hypothetical protein
MELTFGFRHLLVQPLVADPMMLMVVVLDQNLQHCFLVASAAAVD